MTTGMGADAGGRDVDGAAPFGVYLHVPFCRHRCDYCAFATYTDRDHLMEAYAAACVVEVRRATEREGMPPATSVYIGGGTPSRLPADLLASVLGSVPVVAGAEVTVECNPEDVTPGLLAAYRTAGVTRVSLGVQSTVGHVLEGLGRRHGPAHVTEAAALVAGAGLASWNMDLILGGAGERDEDWRRSLLDVLGLTPPPHVSAYALTVEPGTPLARDTDRHPDDDVQAERYESADRILSAAGYRWEEISNWALPGHECRHNRLYWDQGDYEGFGSAAHSHRQGHRYWNLRTPERYIAAIRAGRSPRAGEEVLDESTRRFERDSLALRTTTGAPIEAFESLEEIAHLIEVESGRVRLAPSGRLLANQVIVHLRTGS